jgi:hypothetical protein
MAKHVAALKRATRELVSASQQLIGFLLEDRHSPVEGDRMQLADKRYRAALKRANSLAKLDG